MSNEKALITGVAGFTGYHLVSHLQEAAPVLEIIGIDIRASAYSGNYEFLQVDLLDRGSLPSLIRRVKPAYIFHLGGVNFSTDPKPFYDVNVVGTLNLLEGVRKSGDQVDPQILIIGSSAEYGIVAEDELPISEENPLRPVSHYGVSKVAQDLMGFQYFRSYGLRVIRARPFNLIGPGQPADFVCGTLAKQVVEVERGLRPPEILVGKLEPERDFIDVRDVVRAYWQLMQAGREGEVYNIGSGRSHSIREVLQILIREAGVEVAVKQDERRVRQPDISRQMSSIEKIRGELGWIPQISLDRSLRDMLDYFRAML